MNQYTIYCTEEQTHKIERRAVEYMDNYPNMDDPYYGYYVRDGYIKGATDQREIDIEKFAKYAEGINKINEEIGISTRIDVDSMRKWAKNILYGDKIQYALKSPTDAKTL